MKKPSIPTLLSFNAGYVDTSGFMALHGLFTAHVTGNFVTIGAALVMGASGIVTKLLALPTFCVVVMLARLLRYQLIARGLPVMRTLLVIKFVLLALAAVTAIRHGPFPRGDDPAAMFTGLTLVAGMAFQNALQRVHLAKLPPTTMMTGTTTQIMLDVGDLVHGMPTEQAQETHQRLARMIKAVAAFAVGCASGALVFYFAGTWCFAVPAVIAGLALFHPAMRELS